jgi:hypothetical protein
MVSMNSSKFGCNCPKFGWIKSGIFFDLSENNANNENNNNNNNRNIIIEHL